jgi:hypothetical protein
MRAHKQTGHGKRSRKVHALRSELLRLLDPPATENFPERMNQTKGLIETAGKMACHGFAENCLPLLSAFLERKVDSLRAFEFLKEMLIKAGEVSFKLWTQKSSVAVCWLEELPEIFWSDSDVMEAHRLHCEQLEEDDKSLDGGEILLVTHPAVILYGDSDGQSYAKKRVLKKAVVWMGPVADEVA